eukprot:358289-Chlamydomonas_euryale.AAC.3
MQPAAAAYATCGRRPCNPPAPPMQRRCACHRSQQICFGVQTPQEIVKCGVFHVYERALYKVRITAENHGSSAASSAAASSSAASSSAASSSAASNSAASNIAASSAAASSAAASSSSTAHNSIQQRGQGDQGGGASSSHPLKRAEIRSDCVPGSQAARYLSTCKHRACAHLGPGLSAPPTLLPLCARVQMPERVPHPEGVLDRRLVSSCMRVRVCKQAAPCMAAEASACVSACACKLHDCFICAFAPSPRSHACAWSTFA